MGKVIWRGSAKADDPIYTEGFTMSFNAVSPASIKRRQSASGMTPDDSQTTDESSTPNEGVPDDMKQATNETLREAEYDMYHADLTPEAKKLLGITKKTDPGKD